MQPRDPFQSFNGFHHLLYGGQTIFSDPFVSLPLCAVKTSNPCARNETHAPDFGKIASSITRYRALLRKYRAAQLPNRPA
jgi:hypothetical protein